VRSGLSLPGLSVDVSEPGPPAWGADHDHDHEKRRPPRQGRQAFTSASTSTSTATKSRDGERVTERVRDKGGMERRSRSEWWPRGGRKC